MIIGVYVRRRPKAKWFLMQIASSIDQANSDKKKILDKAKSEGDIKCEVGFKVFSSALYIPEIVKDVDKNDLTIN